MAVPLFAGSGDQVGRLDSRELVRATSGNAAPGEFGPPGSLALAAGVFDARNHQTLTWVDAYASGRIEHEEPFGTEFYLMDMEPYTQFVGYRLIHDLLVFEQRRPTPVAEAERS
jgi:hypothetical protein